MSLNSDGLLRHIRYFLIPLEKCIATKLSKWCDMYIYGNN